MKARPNAPCPCDSGLKYKRCCLPHHQGDPAPTAEALMRSRYAAYVLGKVDYIIETTDPEGPQWEPDAEAWAASIRTFAMGTAFEGLKILGRESRQNIDYVTFRATLTQGARDASFTERSAFRKVDGRWRYHSGGPPLGAISKGEGGS